MDKEQARKKELMEAEKARENVDTTMVTMRVLVVEMEAKIETLTTELKTTKKAVHALKKITES